MPGSSRSRHSIIDDDLGNGYQVRGALILHWCREYLLCLPISRQSLNLDKGGKAEIDLSVIPKLFKAGVLFLLLWHIHYHYRHAVSFELDQWLN